MKGWWSGKPGGLLAFVAIVCLLTGGLGWATASALRLEREQSDERAAAVRAVRLRLALWRLDGRIAPLLAREDARPLNHYNTLYPPPFTLSNAAAAYEPGTVLEPSPLLQAELPPWMLLHFQAAAAAGGGWSSPQVPPPALLQLKISASFTSLPNVTEGRSRLLRELSRRLRPSDLIAAARKRVAPATWHDTTLILARRNADLANSIANLSQQQAGFNSGNSNSANPPISQSPAEQSPARQPQRVDRNLAYKAIKGSGQEWLGPIAGDGATSSEVIVSLTPMVPVWLHLTDGSERLALVRLVNVEMLEVCQGVLLDDAALRKILQEEIGDLFPEARLVPGENSGADETEPVMATLPFRLDPGPDDSAVSDLGWTTLRVGLLLAWLAALVAVAAVGLGGWSLLDLSERRARFVSAVTHELRTPLTTLRLYLDMLVGGMVRDPARREEYIQTLNGEAERLHRLVANVLDFARLERHRPRANLERVEVALLLERIRATWQQHCQDSGKELIFEAVDGDAALRSDAKLVEQVLGNLIDNACKYSRGAENPRIEVRYRMEDSRAVFEVEDFGPGIAANERRAIFRAFRRGRNVDVTAGGVGLGLALARRWTEILGGRLILAKPERGACFRVELPAENKAVMP